MTGAELRRIMKVRRIRTTEAAHALGIHPQTIRNLWVKDEVPRLYLMALTSYVWALGTNLRDEPADVIKRLEPHPKAAEGNLNPPVVKTEVLDKLMASARREGAEAGRKLVQDRGGDLWSKLK